jgi:cytidyltransferase-like protein
MGGCFDLVHEGHVEQFAFCKEIADVVVVGVVSDARVAERKGPARPIRAQQGRLAVVNAMRDVDYAFMMPPMEPDQLSPTFRVLERLRPNFFVELEENRERWEAWEGDLIRMEQLGVEIVFTTGEKRDSTTDIIRRVQMNLELTPNE